MSRQKNKTFGAFTYAALLAASLAVLYHGVELAVPKLEGWLEQRRILQKLRSPDIKTRQRIVESLEKQSFDFARPFLLEAINDPSLDISIAACRLLAYQDADPRPLMPVLAAAVNDEKIEIRSETARILGKILARTTGETRAAVDGSASPAVQVRSQCLAVLYRLLKDRTGDVRAEAADSLGDAGLDTTVASELATAAGDPDRRARLAIAGSLLRINGSGDRTAAGLLVSMVTDREPVSDRSLAFKLLMQTREETWNQAMVAMVELLTHADPLVQPDVLACLSDAGARAHAVLPALEKLLDDPEPATRATAVMAILRIEDQNTPRLIAVMIPMIADKSLSQECRMDMLARIKETTPAALSKATPGLIRQLGDGDANIRRGALDLLSQIIEDTRAEIPSQADAR